MAITTVDVVTNVVSGVETSNNGFVITTALQTGEYKSLGAFDDSIGYSTLESRYTNRFDTYIYGSGLR
jgi:hypothetical protein